MGIGKNASERTNGTANPFIKGFAGYPKAYGVKTKQTSLKFCYSRKTFAQSIVFPSPKKHSLLFGVPESRKTLRGEEQPSDSVDICKANTTKASVATTER